MASLSRIVAVFMVCTALVAAQTFQYSRGWTNGKRNGMVLMAPRQGDRISHGNQRAAAVAAATALLEDAGLLQFPGSNGPCSHSPAPVVTEDSLQRIRAVIESRGIPTMPFSPQEVDEPAERRRREAAAPATAATATAVAAGHN